MPPAQPVPTSVAATPSAPLAVRIFAFVALLGIPGSLFTAGASIPAGLAALCGLGIVLAEVRVDPDLKRLFFVFAACWAVLLATDLLNGGGIGNFQFTAVNYLPLVAIAGIAHVLRRSRMDDESLLWALSAAMWIAAAISLYRSSVLGVERPGGLYMNPIPYALVIAMWGMMLFSFALRAQRWRSILLLGALVAVVPVVLAESKLVWLAMFIGYGVVILAWTAETRRWGTLALAAGASVLVLFVAYETVAYRRVGEFIVELSGFLTAGDLSGASFGHRLLAAEAGLRAFLDGPLLGYGFVEHVEAARRFVQPGDPDISHLPHLHNDYVTHLVAYGWVGAVFLIVFFVVLLRLAYGAADPARRGAGYALVAMAATYMAGDIFLNIEPITAPFSILVAVLVMRPAAMPPQTP